MKATLRLVTALAVLGYLGCLRVGAETIQPKAVERINGQTDLPPLEAPDIAHVEHWMDSCVRTDPICRWKKEQIKVGARVLVCFDMRPYSGQPGHHIFVYQV